LQFFKNFNIVASSFVEIALISFVLYEKKIGIRDRKNVGVKWPADERNL